MFIADYGHLFGLEFDFSALLEILSRFGMIANCSQGVFLPFCLCRRDFRPVTMYLCRRE